MNKRIRLLLIHMLIALPVTAEDSVQQAPPADEGAKIGAGTLTAWAAELNAQADAREEEAEQLEEASSAKRAEAQALRYRVAALQKVSDTAASSAHLASQELELLPPAGVPWQRHTIDDELRKSEGIRLGDLDRDGLLDLSVAWENQEVTRVYLNPGPGAAADTWPALEVGRTPSVEDSVLVDLNQDGVLDVVSSLEKDAERVVVHWGPKETALDTAVWQHDEFTQVAGVTMWMYAEAIQLSASPQPSLVIGGKNYNQDASAVLGLLIAPEQNPRDLSQWRWEPLTNASWVMSIQAADLDSDGLEDIIFSDKHGPQAGVHWLKNPGAAGAQWQRTSLTTTAVKSANFLTITDLDQDGLEDVLAVVELERQPGAPDHAHRQVQFIRRLDAQATLWETFPIQVPPGIAQSKGITAGDVDLDGRIDIVLSSTGAVGGLIGTSWLRYEHTPFDRVWSAHDISGPEGIKYDLVYLIDLDADGDLDVLANDEKENDKGLGVFWYENPARDEILKANIAREEQANVTLN